MLLYICQIHSFTGVNHNVHYGLWMTMMYQCRFISGINCTHWCGMLIVREAVCFEWGCWTVQLFCQPKTSLKKQRMRHLGYFMVFKIYLHKKQPKHTHTHNCRPHTLYYDLWHRIPMSGCIQRRSLESMLEDWQMFVYLWIFNLKFFR